MINNIFFDKIEDDLANANNLDIYINNEIIPKFVFIVPYRNRENHQTFFSNHMKEILSDYHSDEYKIYYIHQCDDRSFNRGAMKNIGFLMIKQKYPFHYKNITLVFNDVDIMPIKKGLINYETNIGVLKHYYGYIYGLGGIVSIKAIDFEKTNGFPNYWAYGYEDNLFQKRVIMQKIKIDRSEFYNAYNENIIELHNGTVREISEIEYIKYMKNINEGINTIYNLTYTIDESTGFVNVDSFETGYLNNINKHKFYELKDGNQPFKYLNRKMSMILK
jgi:hypothetical protein